jgi:hypothetical protein
MHRAIVGAGRPGPQAVSKGDVCPRDEQKVVADYNAIDLGPEPFLDALRCIRLTWSRYLVCELRRLFPRRFDLPCCRLD